jgi:hypothetical protein
MGGPGLRSFAASPLARLPSQDCHLGCHGNRGLQGGYHRSGYQAGYHCFGRYAGPVRTQVRREAPLVGPPPFGKMRGGFRRTLSRSFETSAPAKTRASIGLQGQSGRKSVLGFETITAR